MGEDQALGGEYDFRMRIAIIASLFMLVYSVLRLAIIDVLERFVG